ncbi:tRNA (guanosine(37)-N1)-methyltransferase TrmD [bacterium]|nr:tRNA (guanosine(37)-N1)-methyltransferase TrmD [bacterium]
MRVDVITPFPGMIEGALGDSIIRRAREKDIVDIVLWDLRDFTEDRHKTVDDYAYGGGAGMIMKPEPLFRAFDAVIAHCPESRPRVIFMTPQGTPFHQETAWELSREEHLVFLCGHYRGVDERVIESLVTDEISIGDYILTGGELPAAVVVDAVVRLLPDVLGDFDSAEGDSFTGELLDYPHYTRPAEFRGMKVPEVLISGHHANIEEWRNQQAYERTLKRRPDLLKERTKTKRMK